MQYNQIKQSDVYTIHAPTYAPGLSRASIYSMMRLKRKLK